MDFTRITYRDLPDGGSWLLGYVNTTYENLVTTFGEPEATTDSKTDAEWVLRFADGTFATIYNYKDGVKYLGPDGTPVEDITEWHIGGNDQRAVGLVRSALA